MDLEYNYLLSLEEQKTVKKWFNQVIAMLLFKHQAYSCIKEQCLKRKYI